MSSAAIGGVALAAGATLRTSVVLHVVLLGGSLLLSAGCLSWIARNRDRQAATEFGVFLVTVSLWALAGLVEVVGGPGLAYHASFATEAIRALMAASWFYFTTTYAGYGRIVHSATVRTLVLAGTSYLVVFTGVPSVAMTTTFEAAQLTTEPFAAVALSGSTRFHDLAKVVGYLFVGVGTAALLYRLVSARYTSHWQTVSVVGAVVAVVASDWLVRGATLPVAGVDYSVVGTSVASLVFVLALYRGGLFAFVPVGRDHVFENMDEGVVLVNPDHRVLDVNPAAREMIEEEVPIGERIESALPPAIGSDERVVDLRGGRTNVELASGGDGQRHYEMSVTTLSADGENGVAIILRDVTERERRERELERQNERLDEFATVVSHDLRNPLNVAEGRLELAREDRDDEHLDAVADAHGRMADMIDDLLALARTGDSIGQREPVDLADVAASSWETIHADDASLVVDADRTIRPDPNRLSHLLENLFRNAVEHGRRDVTVTIGGLPDGFYVADDGPGVPEEDRERVFDSGYSTGAEGIGVGLSIVREIADAHGWDVDATESRGGGARVELSGVEVLA